MLSNSLLNNSEFFVENSLQFESENFNMEHIPSQLLHGKFGILKLNAISAPMSQEQHEFIFMVDRSGSMSDMCSDGREKIQHILHTLKNMIIYFKDNKSDNVYVNIFAFDDIIEEIVSRTVINEENIDTIIAKIKKITPIASTDIEKALISIKTTIDKIRLENPTHNICNIFMTDGEATSGNCNYNYLSSLLDTQITNAFIGFGIDHDVVLLNSFAKYDKTSYYFIDKLENSGIVYGEILHGILYKILSNISIETINCLIYDYKNNVWCNSLKVEDIVSESNKVYHIISSTPNDCRALIKAQAKVGDNITQYEFSIFNENLSADLSKNVFRQRTLQLLYKINKFIEKKNYKRDDLSHFIGFENNTGNIQFYMMSEQNKLKTEMKNFMNEMKKYMADNNLNDDGFMKNLCDDIYISYRTFDTKFGEMYNTARQTSQGNQRFYTVTHTPEETCETPTQRHIPLTRQTNSQTTLNLYDIQSSSQDVDLDDVMNHVLSNFEDSPYLTPGATQVMIEISHDTNCELFAQSKNNNSCDTELEDI
jgi:AraC-like DNA-binding protein